jgi:Ca2+/Na+ antiporter
MTDEQQPIPKPKRSFTSDWANTLNNFEFHQYVMEKLYFYVAGFWFLVMVVNIWLAYVWKNGDLIVICILWALMAYKFFKIGLTQRKENKEAQNGETENKAEERTEESKTG